MLASLLPKLREQFAEFLVDISLAILSSFTASQSNRLASSCSTFGQPPTCVGYCVLRLCGRPTSDPHRLSTLRGFRQSISGLHRQSIFRLFRRPISDSRQLSIFRLPRRPTSDLHRISHLSVLPSIYFQPLSVLDLSVSAPG